MADTPKKKRNTTTRKQREAAAAASGRAKADAIQKAGKKLKPIAVDADGFALEDEYDRGLDKALAHKRTVVQKIQENIDTPMILRRSSKAAHEAASESVEGILASGAQGPNMGSTLLQGATSAYNPIAGPHNAKRHARDVAIRTDLAKRGQSARDTLNLLGIEPSVDEATQLTKDTMELFGKRKLRGRKLPSGVNEGAVAGKLERNANQRNYITGEPYKYDPEDPLDTRKVTALDIRGPVFRDPQAIRDTEDIERRDQAVKSLMSGGAPEQSASPATKPWVSGPAPLTTPKGVPLSRVNTTVDLSMVPPERRKLARQWHFAQGVVSAPKTPLRGEIAQRGIDRMRQQMKAPKPE